MQHWWNARDDERPEGIEHSIERRGTDTECLVMGMAVKVPLWGRRPKKLVIRSYQQSDDLTVAIEVLNVETKR